MASSLYAQAVFFIAVIFASGVVGSLFMQSVNDNNLAMAQQRNLLDAQIRTRMKIESFAYNPVEEQSIIYVRNIGSEKILPKYVDIYMDSEKIDKSSNVNISVTADTNTHNAYYWDPNEILLVAITKAIDNETEHLIVISENHGITTHISEQPLNTSVSFPVN